MIADNWMEEYRFSATKLSRLSKSQPRIDMTLLDARNDQASRNLKICFLESAPSLSDLSVLFEEMEQAFEIDFVDLRLLESEKLLFVRFFDIRAHLHLKLKLATLLTQAFRLVFLQPISSYLNSDLLLMQVAFLKDENEICNLLKPHGETYFIQKAARNKFLARFCDERKPALLCNRKGCWEMEQYSRDSKGSMIRKVVGSSMSVNLTNYNQIYFKMINPFKLKSTVRTELCVEDKENVEISKIIQDGFSIERDVMLENLSRSFFAQISSVSCRTPSLLDLNLSHSSRSETSGKSNSSFELKWKQEIVSPVLSNQKAASTTTMMLKNIPNSITLSSLLLTIRKQFEGVFDLVYLPMDFKNKCSLGYAFINFINATAAERFRQAFTGHRWNVKSSAKIAEVREAKLQGRGALLLHFRRGTVVSMPDQSDGLSRLDFLPLVLPNPDFDNRVF